MKRTELSSRWSSFLVSPIVMAVFFLCGIVAAFFGQTRITAVLMFAVVFSLISRIWAQLASKNVNTTLNISAAGVFPDDDIKISVTVRNEKFLPLIWLELFMPLTNSKCLVPQESRKTEEWEAMYLKDNGLFPDRVSERRLSSILWYETNTVETTWHAEKRGLYSTAVWQLRTGDGFGLTQIELPLNAANGSIAAVYPRLTEVNSELFMRNLWNSESGERGVMEDITVIRSTREYMPSDSVRHINWRLAARGLPLAVNVYEDILPKSAHFIFDGNSFLHSENAEAELEDALSILASLCVKLSQLSVSCGISMPGNINLFAGKGAVTEELLYELAAYELPELKREPETGEFIYPVSDFNDAEIIENENHCGRFYYICHDSAKLQNSMLLGRLGKSNVTVLSYKDETPYGEYETVCFAKLKGGQKDV